MDLAPKPVAKDSSAYYFLYVMLGICFGCCTIDTGAPGSFTHGSKGDFGACTKGTLGACAKGIFGNCVSFIIVYKYKIIKLLVNINWF